MFTHGHRRMIEHLIQLIVYKMYIWLIVNPSNDVHITNYIRMCMCMHIYIYIYSHTTPFDNFPCRTTDLSTIIVKCVDAHAWMITYAYFNTFFK